MNKLLLVCFSMLASFLASAQNVSISGHLKEASGAAVVSATVSLLNASDSSWVTSTLSGDKGNFSFTDIVKGDYLVNVTALGYKRITQPITATSNNEIILDKISNELEEVVIKSNHPTIQSGLGKLTLNFEQTRVNVGSNVLDLLRKSPGVTVDANSNISLQGSGVLVLINDKQTYLSGQELADYLKSVSAEQIAQLELISQPSSKYDAEGAGGIINIKTKKNLKVGYSGSIDLTASQSAYPSTFNTANVNYNGLRTNLYANAGYLRGNGFMTRHDTRKVHDANTGDVISEAAQDVDRHEVFSDANLQIGGDYRINDKLTVGGSAKGAYHPNDEDDHTQTVMTDNGTVINNSTYNSLGFRRNNYFFNVFANYTLAKDHSISVDADYLYRDQKNFQNIESQNFDANMQPVPGGQTLRNVAPSLIKTTVVKADYTGTTKKLKVEAGVKTSVANVRNGTFLDKLDNGTWTQDPTRSNDFLYKENINAAYANATTDLGSKWKAQVGLRIENANIEGDELMQGQGFSRSTTNLFPTAFVSYQADEKNGFELNCGRRINRPSYTELNPFVFIYSQYYYQSGNTNLKPSFRNYLECKYNHNNKFFASIGYRKVTDLITPVIFYDSATKATYASWGNFTDRNVLAGSININDPLFQWWLFNGSADFYYNDFHNASGHLASSFGYSIGFTNQFTLPHGWSVDSTIYYYSGDLQNLIDRYGPSWYMDLNVAKKFWKEKATIKLSMEDPFYVSRYSSTTNFNNIETTSAFRYASQQFRLGFTYSFGKTVETNRHQSNIEEASRM